ncbi:polysaccharide biosynthesis tyrosine autokinase [Bradyrhizobium sp. CB2312]|uniref:polysaccharide biosynthesis tyrosine autokinase n=1 Tax=Bradyrhizobium sp. CB2312 TaxID=3039155 RepID=UPI0024B1FB99|nr:polysaccharide biosynthesis tyrosine autokinase [Bradyrhizobium sp. CB2312]WFU70970.1 polysaccharide biosynthesis tyrosine autokinase [Bradyrhizobium sp. CB2312]
MQRSIAFLKQQSTPRMLHSRLPSVNVEAPEPELLSISDAILALKGLVSRQLPLMIFVFLACVSLGLLYVITAQRMYTSTASLIIDSRKINLMQQQQSAAADAPIESAMIDSQVEIIKSDTIALSVIKDLRLVDEPEFTGDSGGLVGNVLGAVFSLFSSPTPPSEYQQLRKALSRFQKNLAVKRVGLSYVIEISYRSTSADRAAQISNAVAEAYIVDSLEAKYNASRRAAVWLQDRMKELRAQASAAERAVADYKAKNNIVDAGGRLLSEQQLAEINSALTTARAQRAEAQARLERITAILKSDDEDRNVILNDLATVADTMQNPVIVKLRQTYLDYAAKESDWSNRYGANHLAVINLRNQMREIRRSIKDELRRTAESFKSDLEIAKSREEASQKSLNDAISQSNDTSQAQIVLRDLESNAQSARALSDNFLQMYMVSVQQQSFPITEARVITPAAISLSPSSPKTLLVLLGSLLVGGLFAGAGAFIRDMMDRVFRTAPQVEAMLGMSCLAVVPRVQPEELPQTGWSKARTVAKLASGWRQLRGRSEPEQQVVPSEYPAGAQLQGRQMNVTETMSGVVTRAPFSRFAEAMRAIKMAIDLSRDEASCKIIGITSSLPNEGKSTIAGAIAQASSMSGTRTLLVDCDIRNPSLTRRFSPDAQAGLIELVLGQAELKDLIWTDSQSTLHFLPCVIASRSSNSADLLASAPMERLFKALRNHYDLIIVDLSPLAPVIDVRGTSRIVDHYTLVVEWAETKIDVVKRCLEEAPGVQKKLMGIVLNKVDIAALGRYDAYRGDYYRNRYYHRYGYVD